MVENFNFFGKIISPYMLTALAGAFAAGIVTMRLAKKHGEDENEYLVTLLWSAVGLFAGGHFLYALTNIGYIPGLLQNWESLWRDGKLLSSLTAIFGGSVFYGGLLGGILAAFICCRLKKLSLAPYADLGAVAIPLFHAFGRVGCFLSGCCYGIPWEGGPVYRYSPVAVANGIPRFPVQLLETAINCGIFALMLWLYKQRRQKGRLLYWYLLLYCPVRFLLEFLRGDAYRGFVGIFSTSQIISVLLILVSAGALLHTAHKKTGS